MKANTQVETSQEAREILASCYPNEKHRDVILHHPIEELGEGFAIALRAIDKALSTRLPSSGKVEKLIERIDVIVEGVDAFNPDMRRAGRSICEAEEKFFKLRHEIRAALASLSNTDTGRLREALEPTCDSCGADWLSTDGKCHICRRGEIAVATSAPDEGRRVRPHASGSPRPVADPVFFTEAQLAAAFEETWCQLRRPHPSTKGDLLWPALARLAFGATLSPEPAKQALVDEEKGE